MTVKTCNLEFCVTVKENDTVLGISKLLREKKLRYVFVVDKKGYPVGIISVTDVNNRCVAEGKDPKKCIAKEIMTHPIDVVDDCDDIEKAYHIMLEREVFAVPVVNDGKLIGLINFNEAVQKVAKKTEGKLNGTTRR